MGFLRRTAKISRCTPIELREFIEDLVKLDLVEFFGVAKILNVSLAKKKAEKIEDYEMKQGDEILEEILDKFIEMNWYKRNNLHSIIRRALEEKKQEEEKELKDKKVVKDRDTRGPVEKTNG